LTSNSNKSDIVNGRKLTGLEIALAQKVFKNDIDYKRITIYARDLSIASLYVPDNIAGYTPDGDIYFRFDFQRLDYSSAEPEKQAAFVHELVHVWQWQRNVKRIREAFVREYIWHWRDYSKAYPYQCTGDEMLTSYGLEQQARLIEDYFSRLLKKSSGL